MTEPVKPSRLRTAQRSKVKLKIAVSGLSGAGKTYSSLLLARGMVDDWSKIGLIDSETGSGELYSHFGPYQYLDIRLGADGKPQRDPHSPESYIAAIKEMSKAGVEVIVIDSITHEWDGLGGCLESVERLGGRYTDWAKVTPRHKAFLDAILQVPCHVLATMRRKSDYVIGEEERNGKVRQKIEKVGLKEVQREGIEYEFTVQFSIDRKHNATAEKDRTGLFINSVPFRLNEEIGQTLLEWANNGKEPEQQVENYDPSNNNHKILLAQISKDFGIKEVAELRELSEAMITVPLSELKTQIEKYLKDNGVKVETTTVQ